MTKKEYKELLEHFRQQSAYIHKCTVDTVIRETSAQQEARVKMLLEPDNYGLMFNYYFGKDAPVPMADSDCAWYHTAAYKDLYYNAYITLFNFIFRGGAKSTHANMGYAFGLKQAEIMRFFLCVGANELRAKMLLADLQAQFESNNRIKNDFGKQMEYGSWADGQFETTDKCTFMALGIDQPFRGLRLNGVRLEYVSVDDIEDSKKALNKRITGDIADKITGDLEGAFAKDSQRMIVNNNYFSDRGVMAELMKRKGVKLESTKDNMVRKDKYTSLYLVNLTTKYPAELGGNPTEPLMPSWERFSEADTKRIIEKFRHDKPTLYREYYNTPFVVGKLFKKDWIRMVKPKPLDQYLIMVVNWDFAYSEQGCFKGMALIGVDDVRMTVLDISCNQHDIDTNLEYHFRMAKRISAYNSALICYYDASVAQEAVYGPVLLRAAQKYKAFSWLPMPQKSNTDKYLKIEGTLTSPLSSGLLVFSEELEQHPDWMEAKLQLLSFEKGCKTPVDFPDALADCVLKAQEYINGPEEGEDDGHSSAPIFGKKERGGY